MTERRGTVKPSGLKRHGRCEVCGERDRDLRMLGAADFIGWACMDCIRQLQDCQERRFCNQAEHTETGE